MTARCIMLQGTSSHVGKSVLVTGLCRLFYQEGYRVAPFKSQNMALNSYVTLDGGEIGRAQGVQAEAAGVSATVEMNPILIKPKENMVAQVIVLGKPLGDMSAKEYRNNYVPRGLKIIREALQKLSREYEILVIEGAGSPAEINLKDRDLANMKVALLAGAPVILVADIDRGGAFASLIGTLELLNLREREMVAGFIINKFRGDLSLLHPALHFLEERTGLPVLGVVPYINDLGIEEEDSVTLQEKKGAVGSGGLDLAVIRLPHISNYTDFDPLEAEEGVRLRYVEKREELGSPDAVIIPGTKNTTADLSFLFETGLAAALLNLKDRGTSLVGICGGYQMMGEELQDPEGTESSIKEVKGLGLLPLVTIFNREKLTRQVRARISRHSAWGSLAGLKLKGYEIRHGASALRENLPCIVAFPGEKEEIVGAATPCGRVLGTSLHDLFHNDLFRRRWLNNLRLKKGLPPLEEGAEALQIKKRREESYDRLAGVLRENLDLERLYRIMGLKK